ncbi:hypothetical protein [Zunongwangia sp. HGR-M22]|uniref:hypothetical protein n=1 Tax=Zunongwangia sp. HGR-M22 TaxID=3015168 RepID=UPI0022DE50A6|nr:hypothetical protein [Zunongwangia sp. HGR-M22]WBL24229.1 hypothetical protein PBT91_09855 [Zunongwangia sp. HGR-M22]
MCKNSREISLGIIDPYNTINSKYFLDLQEAIGRPIRAIFVHTKSYWNAELATLFCTTRSLATDKKLWKENLDGIIMGYFPRETELAAYTKKALEHHLPIFQFRPILRDSELANQIIEMARLKNRLIFCNSPYRYSRAFQDIYERLKNEEVGKVRFIDLKCYKSDGPDDQWFYKNKVRGTGVISHMCIDLLEVGLYAVGYPAIDTIDFKNFSQGSFLKNGEERAEDLASIEILTIEGCLIKLMACWNMPIGEEALIKAEFYSKKGGLCFHNVEGREDIFMAEKYHKEQKETTVSPPDNSSSNALIHWLWELQKSFCFNQFFANQLLFRRELFKLLGMK